MRIAASLILCVFLSRPLLADRRPPVLIELFTSQGCSSCPPADRVLSTWGLQSFRDGEIVPLAFHVDYWDDLGWTDPFSSAEFTDRQREYAHWLGQSAIYTPEMVVQGRSGFTGSDLSRARKEVEKERSTDPRVEVRVIQEPEDSPSRQVRLRISVDAVAGKVERTGRLYCAVFENGLSTPVRRGENGGSTLRGDFVVRSLIRLAELKPGQKWDRTVSLDWKEGWVRNNSGVAVFLQNPESGEVDGTAACFPLKP